MVNVGRGVAARIRVGVARRGGDALVARLNQCRGGWFLLTRHSPTAGGVARGGGDGLVVGLLRKLVSRGRQWRWWLGRCNCGCRTGLIRQTSIRRRRIRDILKHCTKNSVPDLVTG